MSVPSVIERQAPTRRRDARRRAELAELFELRRPVGPWWFGGVEGERRLPCAAHGARDARPCRCARRGGRR